MSLVPNSSVLDRLEPFPILSNSHWILCSLTVQRMQSFGQFESSSPPSTWRDLDGDTAFAASPSSPDGSQTAKSTWRNPFRPVCRVSSELSDTEVSLPGLYCATVSSCIHLLFRPPKKRRSQFEHQFSSFFSFIIFFVKLPFKTA